MDKSAGSGHTRYTLYQSNEFVVIRQTGIQYIHQSGVVAIAMVSKNDNSSKSKEYVINDEINNDVT